MWIKKDDWRLLISEAGEAKVKVAMLEVRLETKTTAVNQYARAYSQEKSKSNLLASKVTELENKLLEMNDALNAARNVILPQTTLNLEAMYDEEDQEEVAKMRERIRNEGADIVLMEDMELT